MAVLTLDLTKGAPATIPPGGFGDTHVIFEGYKGDQKELHVTVTTAYFLKVLNFRKAFYLIRQDDAPGPLVVIGNGPRKNYSPHEDLRHGLYRFFGDSTAPNDVIARSMGRGYLDYTVNNTTFRITKLSGQRIWSDPGVLTTPARKVQKLLEGALDIEITFAK